MALALVAIASSAWLSDDAYITLRVVDNLWSGYGLRWNVVERVQVFTHPLWMLLLALVYGVTREAYWTTLGLSAALSGAAVGLLVRRVAVDEAGAVAALALVAASKSVVEFSSSGLENPLSHALIVAFGAALWRTRADQRQLQWAALFAGLCGLCRLDLLVLVGPPLIVAAWQARHAGRPGLFRAAALLSAPVLLWWAFAFVYYGSIWPNTALAKLPPNIALVERLPQGLRYLAEAATADPVTVLVLLAAITHASWRRGDFGVSLGLIAALGYVVAIGGDFMSGRFLSAPAVLAIAYLARAVRWTPPQALAVAAAALVVGMAIPRSPLRFWQQPGAGEPIAAQAGIVDERSVYAPYTGVVAVLRGAHPREHPWARGGHSMALAPGVTVFEAVGLLGYHAGPGTHIVDPMALTDPLLARLPAERPWRIGHFRRSVPSGYVERLQACLKQVFPGNAIAPPKHSCLDVPSASPSMEPRLAVEYDHLAVLTQLPLFDARRIAELWRGGPR